MKKLAILALLALEFAVAGCGKTATNAAENPTTSINGTWAAILSGGDGQAGVLNFVTQFNVGTSGGTLDITSFSFLTSGPCFTNVSNLTESGSASLNTSSTNEVTGTLNFTVSGGSTLSLDGTTVTGTSNNGALSGGAVSGTWTLSGSTGCSGSGTFILCQGKTTCSTT